MLATESGTIDRDRDIVCVSLRFRANTEDVIIGPYLTYNTMLIALDAALQRLRS